MASSVDDTTRSSEITTQTQTDTLLSPTSDDQSSLTSVPSDIGSTPEGLDDNTPHQPVTGGSPGPICRRSKRQRKLSTRAIESENSSTESTQGNAKRRKTSHSGPAVTKLSTQLSSIRVQAVSNRSSRASSVKSKGPTKIVLKCHSRPDVKPACVKDQKWPESDIRSEPLPSSAPSIPPPTLSQIETETSIDTDIELSFLAKIKDQHYTPVNSTVAISNYVDQPLSNVTKRKVRQANKKQNSRATRSTAASGAEKGSNTGSGAPSPREKAGKPSGITKNAKGQSKFGKGKSRNGGNGGRDRDSPEPHEKLPRTHHDQVLLKSLRQRQSELKKWFAIIGAQQTEALEIMSSRDLSKLHKKPSAHTRVPEYDELLQSLQAKEDHVRALVDQEYQMRQELALRTLQAQKEVIETSFLNRARGAKTEHLKGAEGDLMILQNAHKSQIDETRTDNGSEGARNLPLYHEMPEANARIRGYSSMRIDDEKPFKEHLASYDEQAQREVIDDDIVAPVMLSVAQENAERSAEEERKAREKLNELALVSESELKRINSQPIPKPPGPETNPQFALSRLADCADLVSRGKSYSSVPESPRIPRKMSELPHEASTNPRTLPELPRESLQKVIRPMQVPSLFHNSPPQATLPSPAPSARPKSPPARKKKSISAAPKRPIKEEEPQSQSSSNTSTPLLNIAPAPSKMPPPPVSNHHHHHHHLPQQTMPPPPSTMTALSTFPRHTSLAPLIIPKTRSTPPGTPIHNQGHALSSHIPPPPSPFQPRPSPIISPYQHQQPAPRAMPPFSPLTHPPPVSPFLAQSPRTQSFEQLSRRSPVEPQQSQQQQSQPQQQALQPQQPLQPLQSQQPPPPPAPPSNQPQPPRFALTNTVSSHISRPLGQRRGSGQITFTPTQTPSSERFTRPPGPAPQLPGRSVIRPNQLANGVGTVPNRLGSVVINNAVDSRTQSAADIARQNALKNQVQGAGPKGGKRVLLPKS